jgi:endo-1,3-1,4-beta-glycanase ExoK
MSTIKAVARAVIAVAVAVMLISVLAILQQNIYARDEQSAAQKKPMSASSIDDQFDFLNSKIWKISNYEVSYATFSPSNVAVSNGMLQLAVPAGSCEGGQIQTLERFSYGRFGCRMKTNGVMNTCTSLFTYYREPEVVGIDQIAVEIYGSQPDQMYVTSWKLGRPSDYYGRIIVYLGFDSDLAFHDYEIAWSLDHIDISVDGLLRASLVDTNYLPTHPQRFLLTCFNPSWKGPALVTATASFESAWIRPLT